MLRIKQTTEPYSINEASDWRKKKSPKVLENYNWLNYKDTTNYVQLEDSAGYYYRLPDFWKNPENKKLLEEMKIKYNLRDTSYYIPGEYDTDITLTNDHRAFTHWIGEMIIKIERARNNKIIETKYIIVHQDDGGC